MEDVCEYKGFIVSIDIKEKPTTWIATVNFRKKNYVDNIDNVISPIVKEYARNEGALNGGFYMVEKAKEKIDAYLASL